jgi:hypothetical protein
MRRFRWCSAAVLAIWGVLGGCAFSPVAKVNFDAYFAQFPREKTVPMSASEATAIAKATLEAMGYGIQSATPELGEILTKAQQVPIPAWCDCGTWNLDPVKGTADSAIKVFLTETNQSTRIVLDHGCGTTFNGQNLNGATTVHEVYRCASRGQVETAFWEKFEKIATVRAASANK